MPIQLHKKLRALPRRHPKKTAALAVVLLLWLFCLPRPLFDDPVCTVLEDRRGELLGARIAADGQWRFPAPPADSLPEKYAACVVAFVTCIDSLTRSEAINMGVANTARSWSFAPTICH